MYILNLLPFIFLIFLPYLPQLPSQLHMLFLNKTKTKTNNNYKQLSPLNAFCMCLSVGPFTEAWVVSRGLLS